MMISKIPNYKVSFAGYNYYIDALDRQHAKIKVHNELTATMPTFMSDSMVNSNINVEEV